MSVVNVTLPRRLARDVEVVDEHVHARRRAFLEDAHVVLGRAGTVAEVDGEVRIRRDHRRRHRHGADLLAHREVDAVGGFEVRVVQEPRGVVVALRADR